MSLTLKDYIQQVEAWTLQPEAVVASYVTKAKEQNGKYNMYLSFADDYIKNNIKTLQSLELKWAPIAVKDLILTKWVTTTFGSKIAEKYVPPYNATCFEKLEQAGWCMIGKTNLDEFAMGWSNENSAYWPVINPYGINRVSWGSSGWSAAAVAADLCIAALGTDTWWSVRQPAFMWWIVWLKPTYGRVSRYGVQAMASSFDQVWVMTKTVYDAALLLQVISWQDKHDATSIEKDDTKDWFQALQNTSLKWKKIGYCKQFFGEWIDPLIEKNTKFILEQAKNQWAEIIELDFPLLKYMVAVYYILVFAEVSTNMSRFDGIRYWLQDDTSTFASIKDYYSTIRDKWFGTEVKRRILMWSYVLSAWFYDAYYRKAQIVRAKMQQNMNSLFDKVDVILWPTSPELARKIWERTNDPLKNYLADIYTVPANIGWYPAMNVPTWFVEKDWEQFAVGIQLMAPHWREDVLFGIGWEIEKMILN